MAGCGQGCNGSCLTDEVQTTCDRTGRPMCSMKDKGVISDADLDKWYMHIFRAGDGVPCFCEDCKIRLDRIIKRKNLTFKTTGDNCAEGLGTNKGVCKATVNNETGEICLVQNDLPVMEPVQGRLYSENVTGWSLAEQNDKARTGEYELPPLTLSWTNPSCNVCYRMVVNRFMDAYFSNKLGDDDNTNFSIDAQVNDGWNGALSGGENKALAFSNMQGSFQDYLNINLEREKVGPIVCPGETVTYTMQGTILIDNPDHTVGNGRDGDWVGWHYKAVLEPRPVRYLCDNI